MSGKTIATSETKIEALKLQSSAYGVTIPVIAGVTRIPGNLIYYSDFQAVPHTESQGGKGGVKTTNTTYSYYASVLMGLCAGQISAVPRIWVGKQLYADDSTSGNIGGGVVITNTAVASISVAPNTTATVAHAANFSAHTSLTVPYSWGGSEGGESGTIQLSEGIEFTVTGGVYSFSSLAPTATGNVEYLYTSAGPDAANGSTALQKLGITLMPGTLNQNAPSWVTTRHANEALSYATLAYISADTYPLGPGAQVENHNFEVVGPGAFALGPAVADVDPSVFSINLLLDGRYGARLPSNYFQSATEWSNYCIANNLLMSPALTTQMKAADFLSQMAQLTNTGIVWSDGRVQMRPYGDVAATAYGVTYTPNVTPVYDLTDDVYLADGATPPVIVTRQKKSDAYNHVRVQFQNRANQYAKEIAEAKDQADIEANGLRSASIITADWICDANVARNVAQLILQRDLYVRANYEFKLPWNFAFLEPMDLVTLTDSSLGLVQTAVRITDIEEDGDALKFTAESFALGVANAALYDTQVGAGYAQDYNALPGSAAICYIFEAAVPLATDRLEVFVAAAGNTPSWGGCRVWGSLDGVTYKEIGKISGGSRGGSVTANMTANAVTGNVSLISGVLTSGTAQDATNLATLCYIGGAHPEYLAFQTANLTSTSNYTLSGLVRGAYGSTANTHTTGDPFVRIDENVARSGPLDKTLIGTTVHVKLTSFNIFGFAEESIDAVADHTYTILGTFATIPPDVVTNLSATGIAQGIHIACTLPTEDDLLYLELWRGTSANRAASTLLVQGLADTYDDVPLTSANGTQYYWVRAVDTYNNIGPWAGPVSAVAGLTATPTVVSNLTATGIAQGIHVACTLPADKDLAYVELWRGTTSNQAASTLLKQGLSDRYDDVPLSGANGTLFYWVRSVNSSGTKSAFVGPASTVAGLTSTPSVVTSLAATGIARGIHLSCILPTDRDLAYVELWRGTTSNQAASSMIRSGYASTYDDVPLANSNGTQFYWVRSVNSSGTKSAYVGPASAIAGLTSTPGNMSSLAATGIIGGIRVSGVLPSDADLATVELWWGTTSNQAASTLLASGLSDHYDKLGLLPSDGTKFFWTRCINSSGASGSFVGPVSATAGTAAAANISSVTWSTVSGTGTPADFSDQTGVILANASTSILMNSTSLFKTGTGNAGVFIGSNGILGKNAANATTFSINGATGAATFAGNITGGANITITGTANFGGAVTVSGFTYAVIANNSGGANAGVYGTGTTFGIRGETTQGTGVSGYATSTGGRGVRGEAISNGGVGVDGVVQSGQASAIGVRGLTDDGTGVHAETNGTGNALKVAGKSLFSGQITSNLATGNAPFVVSSTTKVTNLNADQLDGLSAGNGTGLIPISNGTVNTNLNADMLDGKQGTQYTDVFATNAGIATCSAGINILSTVANVETAGATNVVTIRSISDRRRKNTIKDEVLGLAFIERLRPVSYRMNGRGKMTYHGFIAQEVEKLIGTKRLDSLAQTHEDGMKGVDYMSLIAPLVKAVQELSARVADLERLAA